MYIENYSEKFETETGRLIFVPNHKCRGLGKAVHKALLRKWSIPAYFFHFRRGGHVAAAKAHLRNTLFVHMDLHRFYHSVSRTKIHRTLRKFGYPQSSALKIAQWSTVRQDA
jgi:hypothetical protein